MNVYQPFPMESVEDAASHFATGPVPSRPYHDGEWWELEREAIFMRNWLHVAHMCEIPEPGCFIRKEIEFADASLVIVHGKDGVVRSFHNVCTHRGTELVQQQSGKSGKFSCMYHNWTFGTDGSLLSAPDFDLFHVTKESCALKQVSTEVLAGMVFINFDPKPRQSLREFFGPIADGMEQLPVARAVDFTEFTYEIDANWKLNFDNFQENYHLRFIHPNTGSSILAPENPLGYPTHYGFWGPHRSQTLWTNPNPPPPPPTLVEAYMRGARLAQNDPHPFEKTDFKLYPCFHIVALPPGQQYTHTHWPLGPHRTRGIIRMYWTEKADCASRLFFRELGTFTVRDVLSEDRPAVEAGQRGVARIDKIHFQDHEVLLRHLYDTVQREVAEHLAEREAAEA